jgi:hypothetical protein
MHGLMNDLISFAAIDDIMLFSRLCQNIAYYLHEYDVMMLSMSCFCYAKAIIIVYQ